MKKTKFLDRILYTIGSIALLFVITVVFFSNPSASQETILTDNANTKVPKIIYQEGHNLQQVIDTALPYSIVVCDPNQQIRISNPVLITKPLTLRGLNARLPEQLGNTHILEVQSEDVTITDFVLRGNGDTVTQKVRAPLLIIHASNFRVERALFENSSKDGVMVVPIQNDIVGGVIRDIVGRDVVRDVISLSGKVGNPNLKVKNVLIENIRGYNSSLRGVVEVSNGTDQITVHKVYAENCIYAIDLQDHNKQEINHNIIINDVYALNCRHAIRTANQPFGHANVTIMNITAEQCRQPLQVSNTDHVMIRDIRIIDNTEQDALMKIKNCNGLTIRDVIIMNGTSDVAGILVENSENVIINGISLLGETDNISSGMRFRISENSVFSNLRIQNVSAKNVREAGIILESTQNGELINYIISGNIARVSDRIQGINGLVINNI